MLALPLLMCCLRPLVLSLSFYTCLYGFPFRLVISLFADASADKAPFLEPYLSVLWLMWWVFCCSTFIVGVGSQSSCVLLMVLERCCLELLKLRWIEGYTSLPVLINVDLKPAETRPRWAMLRPHGGRHL